MWECGNREGLICKPVTMNFFESCRSASLVYYFNENLIDGALQSARFAGTVLQIH